MRIRDQFVFFDDAAVLKATDRAARKALSKFGAFVRTRAKTSIRKRKRTSKPGEPPSSHTGKLKKSIFFGYDAANQSVVVGPVRYSTNAAEVLENGGIERGAVYRPRPFMKPAFDKELPNAAKLFKNQVK